MKHQMELLNSNRTLSALLLLTWADRCMHDAAIAIACSISYHCIIIAALMIRDYARALRPAFVTYVWSMM
jgi:hypothetical protein